MKVYVVTSGEYSDYHIEKIFTDKMQAHLYSMLDSDRTVEPYNTDDVSVEIKHRFLKIVYNLNWEKIDGIELCGKEIKPHIDRKYGRYFEFTVSLQDKKLYSNIMRYGKYCGMIRKITSDKFAQYLYEHDTTREDLIKKADEKWERQRNPNYIFLSSSMSCSPETIPGVELTPYARANAGMPIVMKKYKDEHGEFPDYATLQQLYSEQLSKETKTTNDENKR